MSLENITSNYLKTINDLPQNVQLVAVSKTHPIEEIQHVYNLGQRIFGENKVQELTEKHPQLPKDIQWHLIGHLQTNKVKYIAEFIDTIQSVDSEKLLEEIDKQAAKFQRKIKILLQVKIAEEETKFGLEIHEAKEIFQNYTKHVIDNIQFTYDHLDFEQLDHVCKYIHDSLEVLVLGLEFSTLLAQHIQNRFALMNKYITVAISNDEQLEAAHNLKENSVVIILSVEGGYFYRHSEVIQILLEKNIKLIVLTMNNHNKMINEFIDKEVILCSQDNTNTESRMSLLYSLEIIIMYYCIYFTY